MKDILTQYQKFLKEITRPISEPKWTTPNTISLELDNVILRNFSTQKQDIATLILPPQAGHHSNIVDYGENQSLVGAALTSGKKSVYAAEWKSAVPERKNETIDDFIISTKKCVEKINAKVNLVGLCQGGWQAAIYASLYPEDINSLILVAAPIDFHAGNNMLKSMALNYPMEFYEGLVNMGDGNMDGNFIVLGFKMLNPFERFYKDYKDLYENIDDKKYVERYHKFRNWYEYTQKLPGKFYLQIVKELFKENKLVKGELEILRKKVDLSRIYQPLRLIAGDKDDLTAEEQLFNIEHYISSKDIKKIKVPAGHIGVFMSTKIIKDYWPKIFTSI